MIAKASQGTKNERHHIREVFWPLLGFLICIIAFLPVARNYPFATSILVSLLLLASVIAIWRHPRAFWSLGGVLVVALVLRWSSHFAGETHGWLISASAGSLMLLFAMLTGFSLYVVINAERVTKNVVMGSMCGYLLMGFVFGEAYVLIDNWIPGAFASAADAGNPPDLAEFGRGREELLYFSFVTLTTLGYGDITPLAPIARSVVILEALSGQLYLATLIARLVGGMGMSQKRSERVIEKD